MFEDFRYCTLESWSRERRVIGKAEYLAKGANPRFVVTDLTVEEMEARALYAQLYYARGDMENRIKEQPLALFADRTSTATLRANQIRLYFSSVADLLLRARRRLGLSGTPMAKAQSDTIRLKLLKIGVHIRITVHRVWIALSESYPCASLFRQVYRNLRRTYALLKHSAPGKMHSISAVTKNGGGRGLSESAAYSLPCRNEAALALKSLHFLLFVWPLIACD